MTSRGFVAPRTFDWNHGSSVRLEQGGDQIRTQFADAISNASRAGGDSPEYSMVDDVDPQYGGRYSQNQYRGTDDNRDSTSVRNRPRQMKQGGGRCPPSRVVHIRSLALEATEADVEQLGIPFGRITNVLVLKNQAFLEFAEESSAVDMVSHCYANPTRVCQKTCFVQFSRHKQLKTPSSRNVQGRDGGRGTRGGGQTTGDGGGRGRRDHPNQDRMQREQGGHAGSDGAGREIMGRGRGRGARGGRQTPGDGLGRGRGNHPFQDRTQMEQGGYSGSRDAEREMAREPLKVGGLPLPPHLILAHEKEAERQGLHSSEGPPGPIAALGPPAFHAGRERAWSDRTNPPQGLDYSAGHREELPAAGEPHRGFGSREWGQGQVQARQQRDGGTKRSRDHEGGYLDAESPGIKRVRGEGGYWGPPTENIGNRNHQQESGGRSDGNRRNEDRRPVTERQGNQESMGRWSAEKESHQRTWHRTGQQAAEDAAGRGGRPHADESFVQRSASLEYLWTQLEKHREQDERSDMSISPSDSHSREQMFQVTEEDFKEEMYRRLRLELNSTTNAWEREQQISKHIREMAKLSPSLFRKFMANDAEHLKAMATMQAESRQQGNEEQRPGGPIPQEIHPGHLSSVRPRPPPGLPAAEPHMSVGQLDERIHAVRTGSVRYGERNLQEDRECPSSPARVMRRGSDFSDVEEEEMRRQEHLGRDVIPGRYPNLRPEHQDDYLPLGSRLPYPRVEPLDEYPAPRRHPALAIDPRVEGLQTDRPSIDPVLHYRYALDPLSTPEGRHLALEDRRPLEDRHPLEDCPPFEDRRPLEVHPPFEDRRPLENCPPFEDRPRNEDHHPFEDRPRSEDRHPFEDRPPSEDRRPSHDPPLHDHPLRHPLLSGLDLDVTVMQQRKPDLAVPPEFRSYEEKHKKYEEWLTAVERRRSSSGREVIAQIQSTQPPVTMPSERRRENNSRQDRQRRHQDSHRYGSRSSSSSRQRPESPSTSEPARKRPRTSPVTQKEETMTSGNAGENQYKQQSSTQENKTENVGKMGEAAGSEVNVPVDELMLRAKKLVELQQELDCLVKEKEEWLKSREWPRDDPHADPPPLTPAMVQNTKRQLDISLQMKALREGKTVASVLEAEAAAINLPSDQKEKTVGAHAINCCKRCNLVFNNVHDFVCHLSSYAHLQNQRPSSHLWQKEAMKKYRKKDKAGGEKSCPVKGAEMLVATLALFCPLCSELCPDSKVAEAHLKSEQHYDKYKEYVTQHPSYERHYLQECWARKMATRKIPVTTTDANADTRRDGNRGKLKRSASPSDVIDLTGMSPKRGSEQESEPQSVSDSTASLPATRASESAAMSEKMSSGAQPQTKSGLSGSGLKSATLPDKTPATSSRSCAPAQTTPKAQTTPRTATGPNQVKPASATYAVSTPKSNTATTKTTPKPANTPSKITPKSATTTTTATAITTPKTTTGTTGSLPIPKSASDVKSTTPSQSTGGVASASASKSPNVSAKPAPKAAPPAARQANQQGNAPAKPDSKPSSPASKLPVKAAEGTSNQMPPPTGLPPKKTPATAVKPAATGGSPKQAPKQTTGVVKQMAKPAPKLSSPSAASPQSPQQGAALKKTPAGAGSKPASAAAELSPSTSPKPTPSSAASKQTPTSAALNPSTALKPATSTAASKPTPAGVASKPPPTSAASKPPPPSAPSKPTPPSEASKPLPTNPASKPSPASAASKPTPASAASKPTPASAASKPTPASAASKPTPASASKPTPANAASKPTPANAASKPTPANAGSKPTPASAASKPAPASVASKPAPASAASKPTPASAASKPTPASAASKPTPASAASKPTPASAASKPAPASVASKLTPASAASKPTPASAGSKPTPASPASKLTPASAASKPTPASAASKPTPTSPASKLTPASAASKPTPANAASKPTPASAASKPTPASASKPSPANAASKPTPASAASKPTPASAASKPTPASAASKPIPTSPASKPTPTSAAPKPTPTSAASKPPPTNAASKPSPTSAASKPSPTGAASKPPPTSAASKPPPTGAASKPSSTSAASKPSPTSAATKPIPASASKPSPTSPAPKPTPTSPAPKPTPTSPACKATPTSPACKPTPAGAASEALPAPAGTEQPSTPLSKQTLTSSPITVGEATVSAGTCEQTGAASMPAFSEEQAVLPGDQVVKDVDEARPSSTLPHVSAERKDPSPKECEASGTPATCTEAQVKSSDPERSITTELTLPSSEENSAVSSSVELPSLRISQTGISSTSCSPDVQHSDMVTDIKTSEGQAPKTSSAKGEEQQQTRSSARLQKSVKKSSACSSKENPSSTSPASVEGEQS